eukprot:COSAG01_NODE_2476_length_7619_cov_35.526596_6_plen_44_part_00
MHTQFGSFSLAQEAGVEGGHSRDKDVESSVGPIDVEVALDQRS